MGKTGLKIMAVIPARGGSKGLPGKNLKPLCGKPLIYYVIKAARECSYIDKVVVSTDDGVVANEVRIIGTEVPFLRPRELSQDSTPLNPVIKHAMEFYDSKGWQADVVISLQPTNPFTTSKTIERAIEKFLQTNCDSVVTVTEIKHGHPYRAKKLLDGDRLENFCKEFNGDLFLNRQERPSAYTYTGAIYLRKRELVESWNGVGMGLGEDCRAVIVDEAEAVNIDSEIDFKFAELLLKERQKNEDSTL